MSDGILQMNLAGLEPELISRIKALAAVTIRTFDGSPEHVNEFQQAQRLWSAIEDLEARNGV